MKGLTILAYHRVHPERRGALCVTPVDLERQIRILLARGVRPIGGSDLVRALSRRDPAPAPRQAPSDPRPALSDPPSGTPRGRRAPGVPPAWSVPARFPGPPSLLVTFDDGYADVARHAWPVLRRLGVPAVVFLIHDRVGRGEPFAWEAKYNSSPGPEDFPLDWTQVLGLRAEGCEFGSHTLTHPDLGALDPGSARDEIALSRARLEERLGGGVDLFCYPRGFYAPGLAGAAAAAGYAAAVLTPRRAGLGEHRFCLRRVGVYAVDRGWRYRLKVSPVFETLREARMRWSSSRPAFCS